MKRLLYVRHAETEMNVAGIFCGHSETNLTEKGRLQAKTAGRELKKKAEKIDLIICSPMTRTLHTARIIAEEIGYPKHKIEKHELLVERSFGILDGKHSAPFLKDHTREDLDKVENAETIEELQKRANRALEYLQSLPHDNVLVVSHGTFGRALKRAVDKLPHTHEYTDGYLRIGNAEILELV